MQTSIQNKKEDQIKIPQEIRFFLEDLLKQSQVTYLDEDMHEAMIEELYIRLDKFLFTKMLEFLPVEKVEEFSTLSADPSKKEILQQFITENIKNAPELLTLAFAEFKNEYESYLATAKNTDQKVVI
jgi:hypothetical protein